MDIFTANLNIKCKVFDLNYDEYNGVIVYIKVISGTLRSQIDVNLNWKPEISYTIKKLGVKTIDGLLYLDELQSGEIGWFTANIRRKQLKSIKVGDFIVSKDLKKPSDWVSNDSSNKSTVFGNLFPDEGVNFQLFKNAIEELFIQDKGFDIELTESRLLGVGFRCGYTGILHKEIIKERLIKEYNCSTITSSPSITFKIIDRKNKELITNNISRMPNNSDIKSIEELFIKITIITPSIYVGKVMNLCKMKRGENISRELKNDSFHTLIYDMPFLEFIHDFQDNIKSISQGFASFYYEMLGFRKSKILKVDILLNGDEIPDLSFLVHESFLQERARSVCQDIKAVLRPQNFTIPIQAVVGKHIVARETLPALKKLVTGNLYGGDRTRKMKLWEAQKRGKKQMKSIGKCKFEKSYLKDFLNKQK